MKNLIRSVVVLLLVLISVSGCSKIPEVDSPFADFVIYSLDENGVHSAKDFLEMNVSLQKGYINGEESELVKVEFEFLGYAYNKSIWTGDKGHNYDAYLSGDYSNKGLIFSAKNVLTHTYTERGVYKIYCIANNWAQKSEQEVKQDVKVITLTVK